MNTGMEFKIFSAQNICQGPGKKICTGIHRRRERREETEGERQRERDKGRETHREPD